MIFQQLVLIVWVRGCVGLIFVDVYISLNKRIAGLRAYFLMQKEGIRDKKG